MSGCAAVQIGDGAGPAADAGKEFVTAGNCRRIRAADLRGRKRAVRSTGESYRRHKGRIGGNGLHRRCRVKLADFQIDFGKVCPVVPHRQIEI